MIVAMLVLSELGSALQSIILLTQFAFVEGLFEGEKIEKVRIFEQLDGEIGLRRRKGLREVGNGVAVTLVGLTLDLQGEDVAAPSVFEGLTGVPEAGGPVFKFLEENDVVHPR